MHILLVHPHDINSPVEPWTRRINSLAIEFVKNGHSVKLVYFPLSYSGKPKPYLVNDYEVIPLQRAPSPKIFFKNTIKLIELGKWANVIHFQKCHHYASIPAVVSAYINRCPLHYDWDDWEEMIWYESCGRSLHSKFIGFSFKVLERFLPVLSDTLSVSSDYLKNLAMSFGVKERNIFAGHVGVDLEAFNPTIDGTNIRKLHNINNPLVLYIGQLHGAQYIDLFIKAANIVVHKYPQITFMIVGEGFMSKVTRELVDELGMNSRFIFIGAVPHSNIPEYIAAADICVAPFRDTNVTRCKSPLKIVEYMGCGKAIVASRVGEVKRMIGGVGILVEPGNPHALAEGILKLITDRALRDALGKFARQRAEKKYNWPVTAASLLAAYEKLVAKR